MASARSTVSIARTTPAQKPRGEHNITFSCGFSEGWEDVMSVPFRWLSARESRDPQDVVCCARPCQACAPPKRKVSLPGNGKVSGIAAITTTLARGVASHGPEFIHIPQ